MVDAVESANEQIGEAHEERGDKDPWPRRMAVVVSFLAASLALSEMGAKSSQTSYLTHHIAASDAWNFYQAKNLRANIQRSEATLLRSLPNADSPEVQDRIKTSVAEEARMHDETENGGGMKQLMAAAKRLEEERDHEFHEYHGYELTSGALEISIVLASVSVVTRMVALGIAATAIGLAACAYGLVVYSNLI